MLNRRRERDDRWGDRFQVALTGLAFAYSVASLWRPVRSLSAVFADDAAYYLEIARNFVLGHGWTADQIHSTNGFQPLWQYVLVGVCALFPTTPEVQIRIIEVLESVLLAWTMWTVVRLVRAIAGSWPAAFAAAMFAAFVFFQVRQGMESSLLLLLGALLLARLYAGPLAMTGTWRARITTGLLLGALMLTRLDSVFLAGITLLVLGLLDDGRQGARSRADAVPAAALAGLVAAVPVAVYLGYNRIRFGHFMPISGAIKTSFPHPGWYYSTFTLSGAERVLFLCGIAVALGIVVQALVRGRTERSWFWRVGLPGFAVAMLVHDLYALLFLRWAVFGWHFALSHLLIVLVVPVLANRTMKLLPDPAQGAAWVAGILVVLGIGGAFVYRRDWGAVSRESWRVGAYDTAMWIREHLPRDATLAMKDSGYVGLFSERRVVNLDGMVNGFEFQEYLHARRFGEFLDASGVEYFVGHSALIPGGKLDHYGSFPLYGWSHLYDVPSDSVVLLEADEVFRGPRGSRPGEPVGVIWKLRRSVPTPTP